MANAIEKILKEREAGRVIESPEAEGEKFFSVLIGEGLVENFLELRFRDGSCTCFSYTDLTWFNYVPEEGLDLDFGGYLITVKGRGLAPKLFNGIKQKRVAWVKESDVELQDHKGNECFIEEITITPPKGYAEEGTDAEG